MMYGASAYIRAAKTERNISMKIDESILKSEEKVVFELREIYRSCGYSCFKMGKFEEYDLYSQNKDFLVSDNVITFNDTNGKLMALKPDVTLSIVKNYSDRESGVQRLYYNENVYRISNNTHSFKEIMQTGLECLGDLTDYDLFEVVNLAAVSLRSISPDCVLNISHLGILSSVLSGVDVDGERAELIDCIGEKNAHGIREICARHGVDEKTTDILVCLTEAYGDAGTVVSRLSAMTDDGEIKKALAELGSVAGYVEAVSGIAVRVDLSLISDMAYYNGLVFRGFVEGIPTSVLSGGQYDRLMEKLGKKGGAIGFAVYLDLLERMKAARPYDVDVLLLYRAEDDAKAVHGRVAALIAEGKSVSAQTVIPEKLTYRELEEFKGE